MADHELTTQQRNAVLQAIRDIGLRPEDFRWEDTPSLVTGVAKLGGLGSAYRVQALIHEPTGSAFSFDLDRDWTPPSFYAVFHPGREGPTELINAGNWATEFGYVVAWLELVKAEHEAPDLWAEVGREQALVAAVPDDDANTPFTEQEQEQIALQLQELKELLRGRYQLEGEQLAELEERISYLEQASGRLGRIDWRQIVVTQLIALVVRSVLPQDGFHEAVQFLARGLGHLFGGGLPQLPGL